MISSRSRSTSGESEGRVRSLPRDTRAAFSRPLRRRYRGLSGRHIYIMVNVGRLMIGKLWGERTIPPLKIAAHANWRAMGI